MCGPLLLKSRNNTGDVLRKQVKGNKKSEVEIRVNSIDVFIIR